MTHAAGGMVRLSLTAQCTAPCTGPGPLGTVVFGPASSGSGGGVNPCFQGKKPTLRIRQGWGPGLSLSPFPVTAPALTEAHVEAGMPRQLRVSLWRWPGSACLAQAELWHLLGSLTSSSTAVGMMTAFLSWTFSHARRIVHIVQTWSPNLAASLPREGLTA